MIVREIYEGDIVRGVSQVKTRPCVVVSVCDKHVIAVPLTSTPKSVLEKTKTTKALSNNRFLKNKSYYTYSTIIIPLELARKNMIGVVERRTLNVIKRDVREHLNKMLSPYV